MEAVLLCRVLCFCRAGLFSAEAPGMFNVSAAVHAGVGVGPAALGSPALRRGQRACFQPGSHLEDRI